MESLATLIGSVVISQIRSGWYRRDFTVQGSGSGVGGSGTTGEVQPMVSAFIETEKAFGPQSGGTGIGVGNGTAQNGRPAGSRPGSPPPWHTVVPGGTGTVPPTPGAQIGSPNGFNPEL